MRPNLLFQAPIFSQSGYGSHARDVIMALWNSRKFNLSVAPTGWGGTSTTANLPVEVLDVLGFVTQNQIRQGSEFMFIHFGVPLEFRKISPTKNIGITAGIESDKLPDGWAQACNQMDAIIVPSEFIRKLFLSQGVTVPVYAVGEGVDTDLFRQVPGPPVQSMCDALEKLPTEFNFLTGGMWIGQQPLGDRKGIGLVIKLFQEEFAQDLNVGLIVKTSSMNNASPDHWLTSQKLLAIRQGRTTPPIYLLHGEISDQELAQLYTHPKVRAFVTPHSGEAWGRMAAEAAACDLPVIATKWSGTADFLKPDVYFGIEYELGDVPQQAYAPGLFQPGMKWAYPKIESVRAQMRLCYTSYETIAVGMATAQGEHIRTKWSKAVTDKLLVETFLAILKPSSIIMPPAGR